MLRAGPLTSVLVWLSTIITSLSVRTQNRTQKRWSVDGGHWRVLSPYLTVTCITCYSAGQPSQPELYCAGLELSHFIDGKSCRSFLLFTKSAAMRAWPRISSMNVSDDVIYWHWPGDTHSLHVSATGGGPDPRSGQPLPPRSDQTSSLHSTPHCTVHTIWQNSVLARGSEMVTNTYPTSQMDLELVLLGDRTIEVYVRMSDGSVQFVITNLIIKFIH